jgi:hypothetical protein
MSAQHLDHLDAGPAERGAQAPHHRAGGGPVAGVDHEDHLGDVVVQGGLEELLDGLMGVLGRREVDAGVEGLVAAEGEHHHRLVRFEAKKDRHHGQDVLGRACGEGGGAGRRARGSCHADDAARRRRRSGE